MPARTHIHRANERITRVILCLKLELRITELVGLVHLTMFGSVSIALIYIISVAVNHSLVRFDGHGSNCGRATFKLIRLVVDRRVVRLHERAEFTAHLQIVVPSRAHVVSIARRALV